MNVIREKLNILFQKKGFYIAMSIIASIALWAYVAYAENPDDVDAPLSGIPIEFINNESLTNNGLIVTGVSRETTTVTFVSKRNTVRKILASGVTLTVDLSDILDIGGTAGTYQLPYDITYPSGIDVTTVSARSAGGGFVTVSVENLVHEEIPVRGIYDGEVVDGYRADPMEFTPATIEVSGPESMIKAVSCAWASVQRENISSTVETDTAVSLIDEDGNLITSDLITMSANTVRVRIPVVVVKDVTLDVNLAYGASATETNVIYKVEPSSVTLSGDVEILGDTNTLTLGTVDLTSFATNTELELPIILPNGVENSSGVTTARVTVQILDVDTAKLTTTNIETKNETPGKTTNIVTRSVDVTLRGIGTTADLVKSENVRIVADLAELGDAEGVFSVPAKVYVDGTATVDAIGEYYITVNVGA